MNERERIDTGGGHSVSLQTYIERIFDERQRSIEIAFKSQQDALNLASRTLELRLEKLNELRQEVTADRSRYVTLDKYDAEMEPLQSFRSKALGFGALLALLSGALGAAIARAIG